MHICVNLCGHGTTPFGSIEGTERRCGVESVRTKLLQYHGCLDVQLVTYPTISDITYSLGVYEGDRQPVNV